MRIWANIIDICNSACLARTDDVTLFIISYLIHLIDFAILLYIPASNTSIKMKIVTFSAWGAEMPAHYSAGCESYREYFTINTTIGMIALIDRYASPYILDTLPRTYFLAGLGNCSRSPLLVPTAFHALGQFLNIVDNFDWFRISVKITRCLLYRGIILWSNTFWSYRQRDVDVMIFWTDKASPYLS